MNSGLESKEAEEEGPGVLVCICLGECGHVRKGLD